MNNSEFLNICYKFINQYSNAIELVNSLENFNKSGEDQEAIKSMIKDIKDLMNKYPNKVDELQDEDINEKDSYERWRSIFTYIVGNKYFNTCFNNLTDYELLKFISQYLSAPYPPKLDQEEFDKLVKVGIENEEKEYLWRLAFNYNNSELNFDKITNYYIDTKDAYYLCELISAVGNKLDIDNIIDLINDKELIKSIIDSKDVISFYVNKEQLEKLSSKLN